MAWRRNLQVSSVGTSAERLGVGADHDGGRAAGAKGAATEETRKGLRLRILPGTGCHRAGPPSKSGARAGGGRSDDFTQSNCGGTEAELATSATTCLHPQPPSRAYICVRNRETRARKERIGPLLLQRLYLGVGFRVCLDAAGSAASESVDRPWNESVADPGLPALGPGGTPARSARANRRGCSCH